MNVFIPSRVYDAVTPASHTSEDKMYYLPTFDRGAPYFEEPDVIYQHESHPWTVGRTYDQVPPTDISPIRISTSMVNGNKQPSFYVVVRGRRVGVLLDNVAAVSFTNGVTDGYKFKTRSQRDAVEQFNRLNHLGEVKICRTREPRPQVVITANWRVIVGTLALFLTGYLYLLTRG